MSAEQPTLAEFAATDDPQPTAERERAHGGVSAACERVLDGRGAVYGRGSGEAASEATPVPQCRGCGRELAHEERAVGRIMGDNDDCTPVCRKCVGEHVDRERVDSVVSTVSAIGLYRAAERDGKTTTYMNGGQ